MLSFRRINGNRRKMALSDVLDSLIEELVGDVAHIALVVDVDKGESGVINGQLDDNPSAAALASPFSGKAQAELSHTVVQLCTLLWILDKRGQQLLQVLRQRAVALLQPLEGTVELVGKTNFANHSLSMKSMASSTVIDGAVSACFMLRLMVCASL